MSDMLQLVDDSPHTQGPRSRSTNVRYASEPLAKFNFSFSPGFSLGSVALLKAENRFNGLHRDIDHFGAAPETVKTVAEIQCAAVTPG